MSFDTVLGLGSPARILGHTQAAALAKAYPPTVQSDTMVGIEIECERATNHGRHPPLMDNCWIVQTDGSLRNDGLEFITQRGLTGTQASSALKVLNQVFQECYPDIEANARTGVHIHLNFLDKGPSELGALLLLYALFEKSLFKFSGSRQRNIFTVPMRTSFTIIPELLRACVKPPSRADHIVRLAGTCPKYSALNVGALRSHGTVEFRHMAGTAHPIEVLPWLDVVLSLHHYAMSHKLEHLLETVTGVNTHSRYEELANEVFPKSFVQLVGEKDLLADMIQGCAWIKEALIVPQEVDAINPPLPAVDLAEPRIPQAAGGGPNLERLHAALEAANNHREFATLLAREDLPRYSELLEPVLMPGGALRREGFIHDTRHEFYWTLYNGRGWGAPVFYLIYNEVEDHFEWFAPANQPLARGRLGGEVDLENAILRNLVDPVAGDTLQRAADAVQPVQRRVGNVWDHRGN